MFRVLVMDVRTRPDPAADDIFETISEFTFLERLYDFDFNYEFAWVKNQPWNAEILVHD